MVNHHLPEEPQECPKSPSKDSCVISQVPTGATHIPYVYQCTRCGKVSADALDRWVEHALKSSMDKMAQRVALAAEGRPFTFVRGSDADITLSEGLGQALGAASMCWENPAGAGEFDATRAKQVYDEIQKLVLEFQAKAVEQALVEAKRRVREYMDILGGWETIVVGRSAILECVVSGNKSA